MNIERFHNEVMLGYVNDISISNIKIMMGVVGKDQKMADGILSKMLNMTIIKINLS